MTLGSRTRRMASGFAVGTLAVLAGCRATPIGRLTPSPSPNQPQSTLTSATRAAFLPATVAMEPPSEMSSIGPVVTNPSSITPAGASLESGMPPAPLLDSALLRANALNEAAGKDSPAPSAEPSTPSPPLPAPDRIGAVEFPVLTTNPAQTPAPTPTPTTPQEPAKEPEAARPEDLWRDGVRRLVGLARARLEQAPAEGSPSPWGLRARVLAWLAEPDIDPGLDIDHREAAGLGAVLRALDDSPGESPRRGDEVRSAVLVLEEKAPLEITDLRLCCKVDGFGDFEAFEPPVRKAGQPVILYCELDGLRFEQTSAGFRTRTASQVEILPEGGGPPINNRQFPVSEETCRRRRRDYFIAIKLALPSPLAPGDYRIRVTTRDLNGDRSATREASFAIAKD
jgi:hypothetical protein